MRIALTLLLLGLATPAAAAPARTPAPTAGAAKGGAALTPAVRKALSGLRGEALRAHMQVLADDRMEGRGTGTPGYDLAAAYMAEQFGKAGLEPGGAGGSWLQPVPFRRLQGVPEEGGLALVRGGSEQRLTRDADFLIGTDPVHEQAEVTAPLAFAGFGITAPELGYDDYAHVDVKGKIAVLPSGGPPTFPART
jgi:hypothetical protein